MYTQKIIYSCGHETIITKEDVEVTEKVIHIGTPCAECREKENSKQLTKKELMDICKPLNGSESQVEWGTKNRLSFIAHWVKAASNSQSEKIREILMNEEKAGWWMDNRDLLKTDDFVNTYKPRPKRQSTKTAKKADDSSIYINTMKTMALKPSHLGLKDTNLRSPAYISASKNKILIILVGQTAIPSLVKFTPVKEGWYIRELDEYAGDYKDRVTEVALELLKQGCPVVIEPEQLIDYVKAGRYRKEQTRWFKPFNENSICLQWEGYDKILCSKALATLSGARWDNDYKIVVLPATNKMQVEAFAKNNNISISSKIRWESKN